MVRAVGAVRGSVVPEFANAKLGDERRTERLVRVARRVERNPRVSFPQAMRTPGELEGFYRLMNNDGFTPSQMLEPHRKATFERASQAATVLVVHDTTNVNFPGKSKRNGLGVTTASTHQGFVAHYSLVLDAGGTSLPLGVSQLETYTRTGKKWSKTKKTRSRVRDDPKRESLRWWRAVEAFEAECNGSFEAIHVMDAEADFFELLSQMVTSGRRFIIRAGQLDRTIKTDEERTKLRDFVDELPSIVKRTVRITARRYQGGKKQPATKKKRHPERDARDAKLAIGAGRLTLQRTRYSKLDSVDVEVNVLRVWEPNPPRDAPPVEWILLTTEPIASRADIEQIVDWYRQRWVIEEFFKGLKTGCSLEDRQLESYAALTKVAALMTPIAYRLLLLRGLSRSHPEQSPSTFFSAVELQLLMLDDSTQGLPKPTTLADAAMLVARMGGHIKNNGPPGWQTLHRCYQHLLTLLTGWEMATNFNKSRERSDQW
jgi:hypothetical protein